MAKKKKIIPAILANNLPDFKNKLKKISGLADWIQADIMDGSFVKNISLSLADLGKIKIPFKLEIHLMVLSPEKYFSGCKKLKAKRVIFHLEAVRQPLKILQEMEKYSFEKGIAINPATAAGEIKPYLKYLDLVLLLGVTPGFQGQKFNPIVFEKLKKLKAEKIKTGVDGGIKLSNIRQIALAGADYLIVGSEIFKAKNIRKTFQALKQEISR